MSILCNEYQCYCSSNYEDELCHTSDENARLELDDCTWNNMVECLTHGNNNAIEELRHYWVKLIIHSAESLLKAWVRHHTVIMITGVLENKTRILSSYLLLPCKDKKIRKW